MVHAVKLPILVLSLNNQGSTFKMRLSASLIALTNAAKRELNPECKDLDLATKCVNDCTTKFLACIGKKVYHKSFVDIS